MSRLTHTDIEIITDTIRTRILKGIYLPKEKLSENKLATEFDCSRTPIREALKRLEADHLVTIRPQSGSYVKSLTEREAIEITEIRAGLEFLAFKLACEQKASPLILESLADKMEDILSKPSIDFVLYGKTHYSFHNQIIDLSDNQMLKDVYSKLNIGFTSIFYDSMDENQISQTISEHRQIVQFLKDYNSEDGSLFIYHHLLAKRNRIKKAHKI